MYLRFIQNTKEFCSKRKCILSKTSKSFLLNVLAFWNMMKKQENAMQYLSILFICLLKLARNSFCRDSFLTFR